MLGREIVVAKSKACASSLIFSTALGHFVPNSSEKASTALLASPLFSASVISL
jgi:hypothetical protein